MVLEVSSAWRVVCACVRCPLVGLKTFPSFFIKNVLTGAPLNAHIALSSVTPAIAPSWYHSWLLPPLLLLSSHFLHRRRLPWKQERPTRFVSFILLFQRIRTVAFFGPASTLILRSFFVSIGGPIEPAYCRPAAATADGGLLVWSLNAHNDPCSRTWISWRQSLFGVNDDHSTATATTNFIRQSPSFPFASEMEK